MTDDEKKIDKYFSNKKLYVNLVLITVGIIAIYFVYQKIRADYIS